MDYKKETIKENMCSQKKKKNPDTRAASDEKFQNLKSDSDFS